MGFLVLTDRRNVTESGFTGNKVEASTSSFTLLSDVILRGMFQEHEKHFHEHLF